MPIMPVDEHPKCDFIHCLAGQGLAGMGVCFLKGDWANPDCPKFKDEREWVRQMDEKMGKQQKEGGE